MVESVIKYHTEFVSNNIYKLIDPDLKSNNLKGCVLSQLEIIDYIQTNNLDKVDIIYGDKYVIKYSNTNLDKNIIKICPLEPNSVHLLRLINLKKNPEYKFELEMEINQINLPDILMEISDYIDTNNQNHTNPMDYCTVCGSELILKGLDKIVCCSSDNCITQSKHIVIDNRITDLYKKDPFLCEILIDILIDGTTHPKGEKIFKPLPNIKNIHNLTELILLIASEINNLSIRKISESSNDIELNKKIGSNAYAIINNTISDNYFSLNTIEKFQTDVFNRGINGLNRTEDDVFNSKNVKFIGLNYSYEIESKFKKEYYLFHGTPIYSWYPIVKNGLKVMSGTEFMANGAAYGNGIYLSDQFSMSLGYSSRNGLNTNKSRCIVGIFEIADQIEKHKKTQNIFVINNDKIMLLRYLVVINGTLNFKQSEELSDYFIKYLGSINKINEKKSINIKNKRFGAEMKLLNNNSKVANVEIIEEISNWKIQLDEIKGKKILLNIYFNDYPKLPPKIFIESGLDLSIKNIICNSDSNSNSNSNYNSNSSVNIPEINPSKWEITTNLSKIIDIIHNCLMNLL
jgi:hypothetical protein